MRHPRGVENMPPAINMAPRKGSSSPDASGSPEHNGLTGYPIKEETVTSLQTLPGGRQVRIPVILKVYANNFGGRYAVVAQNKVICKDCGYINLKHCTVQAIAIRESTVCRDVSEGTTTPLSPRQKSPQYQFEIVSHKTDGQRFVFTVSSQSELEQWLSVLDPEEEKTELSPRVVMSSANRKHLGELSPTRVSSPRLAKRQSFLMPALEEE